MADSSGFFKGILTGIDSKVQDMGRFFNNMPLAFPLLFLILLFASFVYIGAQVSVALVLLFFFLPGFLFFRYLLKNNEFISTIFAIPFSIAFSSIVFRISLLFTLSGTAGWLSVFAGWLFLFIIAFFLKKYYHQNDFEIGNSDSEKSTINVFFVILTVVAIFVYSSFFGPITPGTLFWGSSDSNWQISTLTYLKNTSQIEMPFYLCAGQHGYELDSFTSTTSLLPVHMIDVMLGSTSHVAQLVFLFLGFVLLIQGIFVLFSKLFGPSGGIASVLFVLLPLSFFPYVPDLLGIWRVSLFNSFLPWALMFGFFWFGFGSSFFLRTILLIFLIPIQPFSAILLVPAYIIPFIREFNRDLLLQYAATFILVSLFFYFTFYQVTFQTIGAGGSNYGLKIGADQIALVDTFPSLVPKLQISFSNLGLTVLLASVISLFGLFYLLFIEKSPITSNLSALFIVVLIGLLLSSGIINLSSSLIQYVLKLRYSVLLVLIFPLISVLLLKVKNFNVIIAVILFMILVSTSLDSFKDFRQYTFPKPASISDAIPWIQSKLSSNQILMYFDSMFGQSAIQQFQHRYIMFPSDITSVLQLTPDILAQKEDIQCYYVRSGLLDIKYNPPPASSVKPDYIVSMNSVDSRIHDFFKANGYLQVDSFDKLILFKKQ